MAKELRIGVVCFATYGGSGVVAAEVGMGMVRLFGHEVHFIAEDVPRRVDRFADRVHVHRVVTREYPLFPHPLTTLGLTSAIIGVAEKHRLDLIHAHYAIPHASSALDARRIMRSSDLKVITTLHGTDITLVGNDPSFAPITRDAIEQSDIVTAPSQFLREATYVNLNVPRTKPIEVVANFVDTDMFAPSDHPSPDILRMIGVEPNRSVRVLMHTSNFRPLKRVPDVVRVFERVRREMPARLVLIGDGDTNEHREVEELVDALNLTGDVVFLGKLASFSEILRVADLFILPSETESFGLAALEAMSCGVPVIASNVGGLPEVVTDGENGFLAPVGDIDAMARKAIEYLSLPIRQQAKIRSSARRRAVDDFRRSEILDRYEALYRRAIGTKS